MVQSEKMALKRALHEASLLKQQSVIDDYKNRINLLLHDSNDTGQHAGLGTVGSRQKAEAELHEALRRAMEEMTLLSHLQSSTDEVYDRAKPGAVVAVDQTHYYISVSADHFDIASSRYVGLSIQSPLYQAMKGFGSGQTFFCKGQAYKIVDVF